MPMHNTDIAALFEEIADLLEIRGENPFRIRALTGFGEKLEANIREAVEAHVSQARRFKLATAAQYAESLVDHLRGVKGVTRAVAAGSYRRMRETVGDLDTDGVGDFDNLRYGVGQARRGWLSRDDVLNTHALPALKKLIAR